MKYISLFSGIEAATVAWKQLGWECVGVSEIDPFACEVLKQRHPNIPNLGDITKITKEKLHEIKRIHTTIDLLVGGSPCQSFSIAGLRKGLDDPRGNLMLEYCRIVKTLMPTYFVWENVPGVLSSNKGKDFGTLLQTMAQFGYSLAWRVLDSKHFGVPQRRRRVFLIGCLGKTTRPFEILFEPESLQRNTQKSKEKRENNTTKTQTSSGEQCLAFTQNQRDEVRLINGDGSKVGSLSSNNHGTKQANFVAEYYESNQTDARIKGPKDIANTVIARYGTGGGNTPLVHTYTQQKYDQYAEKNISPTLTKHGGMYNGGSEVLITDQQHVGTLMAQDGRLQCQDHQSLSKLIVEKQYAGTLTARDYKGPNTDGFTPTSQHIVQHGPRVRRLTPIECERLQGFPDNYTQIAWNNKEPKDCPASHRYKCLGNSMTTNVMLWIGKRIDGINTQTHNKNKKKLKTHTPATP